MEASYSFRLNSFKSSSFPLDEIHRYPSEKMENDEDENEKKNLKYTHAFAALKRSWNKVSRAFGSFFIWYETWWIRPERISQKLSECLNVWQRQACEVHRTHDMVLIIFYVFFESITNNYTKTWNVLCNKYMSNMWYTFLCFYFFPRQITTTSNASNNLWETITFFYNRVSRESRFSALLSFLSMATTSIRWTKWN